MPGQGIHVVPRQGDWGLDGAEAPKRSYPTQREAIEAATRVARRTRSELFVHGRNGQIRMHKSYGRAPGSQNGRGQNSGSKQSQAKGGSVVAETQTAQRPSSKSTDAAMDKAKEQTQEVTEQARKQVQRASSQAKSRVRGELDNRSAQAGGQIKVTAGDLRSVGEDLRGRGKDGPAKLADRVADKTEQLGNYLEQSDADKILSDVEDFARQRPWLVVAGGVAIGLAASRLLKASSSRRYSTSYGYRLPAEQAGRLNQAAVPGSRAAGGA